MRVFVTFNGFGRVKGNGPYLGPPILKWGDAKDVFGNSLGDLVSNKSKLTETLVFRKGNRYVIDCNVVTGGKIIRIKTISATKKKNTCNIFEKQDAGYKFITGKFKGQMVSDIAPSILNNYLNWLRFKTNNEDTVLNIKTIKKIIG